MRCSFFFHCFIEFSMNVVLNTKRVLNQWEKNEWESFNLPQLCQGYWIYGTLSQHKHSGLQWRVMHTWNMFWPLTISMDHLSLYATIYIYIYIYTSTLLNYNNESVIVLKKVDIDLLPALKGHNTFDFSCLVLKRMDTNLTW